MKFKVTSKHITVERCQAHPKNIYLFGDNTLGRGKAGQAVIRDEPNAVGIPTKKYPAMTAGSFLTDEEYEQNVALIDAAFDKIPATAKKVIVSHRIGCHLAMLPMKAPRTYAYLCKKLGLDNDFEGK